MKITLFIENSIEQNAAHYFDRAKKIVKKIEGAKESLEGHKEKLSSLLKKQATEIEKKTQDRTKLSKKKEWYEKFRWFYTSDGFLVVGGRDATSNEVVIKKHTESNDLVFHTDMAGSPFFVIKSEGKEITPRAIAEVSDATCTFSRAWKLGLSTSSVFYVSPDQVSKKTNSGEYMGKGAFMIFGKTNHHENKTNLAIGLREDGKIMAGPIESVSASCKPYLELLQGDELPSGISKLIKAKLGAGSADEIIRALPSGGFRTKKQK